MGLGPLAPALGNKGFLPNLYFSERQAHLRQEEGGFRETRNMSNSQGCHMEL